MHNAECTIEARVPRWRMMLLRAKVAIARALAWSMWRCGVRRWGVHIDLAGRSGAVKKRGRAGGARVTAWPTARVRIVPWEQVEYFTREPA